jgi:hypothetical protein
MKHALPQAIWPLAHWTDEIGIVVFVEVNLKNGLRE